MYLLTIAPSHSQHVIRVPFIYDGHHSTLCSTPILVSHHHDCLTVLCALEALLVPLEKIPWLFASHTSHAHPGMGDETGNHGLTSPRLSLLIPVSIGLPNDLLRCAQTRRAALSC